MGVVTATAGLPVVRLTPRDDERRPGCRVWIVTVNGRDVGIIGDGRAWLGHRYAAAVTWWAALRDTSDWSVPATWNTGDAGLRTRADAIAALLDQLAAPAPRVAIDVDCPGCGYPERAYDPARGVFACSGLNPNPCTYESGERDA